MGALLSAAAGGTLLSAYPVAGGALLLVALSLVAVVVEDRRAAQRPVAPVPRGFDVAFRRPDAAIAEQVAGVPPQAGTPQPVPARSGPRLRGRTLIWHLPPGQVRRRARMRADQRNMVAGRHHVGR